MHSPPSMYVREPSLHCSPWSAADRRRPVVATTPTLVDSFAAPLAGSRARPSGARDVTPSMCAKAKRVEERAAVQLTLSGQSACLPSSERPQLRLRLLQVEPHVHLAVHRRCRVEVPLSLLLVARAPIELAEAEVAVG